MCRNPGKRGVNVSLRHILGNELNGMVLMRDVNDGDPDVLSKFFSLVEHP